MSPTPIETAPADTARAMHAAEMRGQDMQDAPERIWTVYWGTDGAVVNGAWADTVRHFGGGVEYTRTDLCITEAECQRRVDAAVQAAEQRALDSVTTLHTVVSRIREASGVGSAPMLAELPDAIAARAEAAVLAEREACAGEVRRQFKIWEDFGASGFDDLCMAIIPEAIRARGQK